MSGFEITSVVLGAIPLLAMVIEQYSDGLETIRGLRNWKTEFSSAMVKLRALDCSFRQSVERMLVDLVPRVQLAEMMESAGSHWWASVELRDKFRDRLSSRDHETCESLASWIVDQFIKIMKLLGIEHDASVNSGFAASLTDSQLTAARLC
jgi:hypothetical protein